MPYPPDFNPIQMPMTATVPARVQNVMANINLAAELNAMTERAEKAEATVERVLNTIEAAEDMTTDGHCLDNVSAVALRRAIYPMSAVALTQAVDCDHTKGRPQPACTECHTNLSHDMEPIIMSKPEEDR